MKTALTALSLVLATATAAAAQQVATPVPSSDRWSPWMGCWQVAEESVQDAEALLSALGDTAATPRRPTALVCVAPAPDGGATMTTIVDDQPVLVETVIADGTQRPLTDATCRGWQKAEWSQLGARVYTEAEVACGEQPTRKVSALAAMVSGPLWLDVQMIESEGRKSMRVRRYRRAANQKHATAVASPARDVAHVPLGGKLTLADIKEASAKIPPEALQAAVMELGAGGYDLNAQRLLELDAAGVPDSVIDLMVAMSFPKRFVVERASGGGGGFGGYGGGMDDGPWSPWGYWGGGFGALGMWPYFGHPYQYDYSRYGYRNWGYYDRYDFGGPGFVVIDPGAGSPRIPQASGEGRVVNGQGYTRIRRNDPEPARSSSGNQGGDAGTATNGGASTSGSSSSGSSGASSGGYSSGGTSSGSDRTAVPRPPGGN